LILFIEGVPFLLIQRVLSGPTAMGRSILTALFASVMFGIILAGVQHVGTGGLLGYLNAFHLHPLLIKHGLQLVEMTVQSFQSQSAWGEKLNRPFAFLRG